MIAIPEEAKQKGGATCWFCSGHMQVYKRKFNSGMARSLLWLYAKSPSKWVEAMKDAAREAGFVSGEHAKLIWWGLVEKDEDKPLYRLTRLGRQFARGEVTVLSHVREYKGHVIELTGEEVSIRDVIGDHFDYDELMRET